MMNTKFVSQQKKMWVSLIDLFLIYVTYFHTSYSICEKKNEIKRFSHNFTR